MAYRINPALERHPKASALIGHILASFGEIEFGVCRNSAKAFQMHNPLMKAFYKLRVTSSRIDMAEEMGRPSFIESGLGPAYDTAFVMVRHCLKIRNQYAHCNWSDFPGSGLFFADLEDSAHTDDFSHYWKHIDAALLQQQSEYFGATFELLEFLYWQMHKASGKLALNWPEPILPAQPPLHNPEDQHVPPWLDEGQKALHVARALARQGGPPTPTAAQQALDKARAEKRARLAEQRQKSRDGEDRPK